MSNVANDDVDSREDRLGRLLEGAEPTQVDPPQTVPESEASDVEEQAARELRQQARKVRGRIRKDVGKLFRGLRKDVEQTGERRVQLGERIYRLTSEWLAVVVLLLIASGLGILHFDSSVLVTLLGSATAAIVGLLSAVVVYYFTDHGVSKDVFGKLIDWYKEQGSEE